MSDKAPVSCIDMTRMMDADDESDESDEVNDVASDNFTITTARYKQYKSITAGTVHQNLCALQNLQQNFNQALKEYHQQCDSITTTLNQQSKQNYDNIVPWIEGKKEMSSIEQMKFVQNRWNPPLATAKFLGVPCLWARIMTRLPFFHANKEELNVLQYLKNVTSTKLPSESINDGLRVKYSIEYEYDDNHIIESGAVVEISFTLQPTFPMHQMTDPKVHIVKENKWKTEIEQNFFKVFTAENDHKQFLHFYTLATEAIPNQLSWFTDAVVQKKSLHNLTWDSVKEFDYTTPHQVQDNASLPCVQQ
ncbi:Nucleosome assembly protein [Entamoeba marina]